MFLLVIAVIVLLFVAHRLVQRAARRRRSAQVERMMTDCINGLCPYHPLAAR